MTETKFIAEMTPKDLAILFHETYESLAHQFGYETRTETRKFDENSSTGKLMIAVCRTILVKIIADSAAIAMRQVRARDGDTVYVHIPSHYTDSEFEKIAEEFRRIQGSNSAPIVLLRGIAVSEESDIVWVCQKHYKEMCEAYMGEVSVFCSGSSEERACTVCGSVSRTHLAVNGENFKEMTF